MKPNYKIIQLNPFMSENMCVCMHFLYRLHGFVYLQSDTISNAYEHNFRDERVTVSQSFTGLK